MTSQFIKSLYAKCKMHGTGDAQVILEDRELYALILLAFQDLEWSILEQNVLSVSFPSGSYYEIPLNWFDGEWGSKITPQDVLGLLDAGKQRREDFILYIENLCALHRRRVKYGRILATQPIPTMDQVGPRTLLEYGLCEPTLLAHWVIWRKWIYDIDNRAAQETGYVFEPILATCLGGETIGAKNSPVKRIGEDGKPMPQGRQIDCYIPTENLACEFKLRVTIAASGQGRFKEELSFPEECRAAGITPVLLVLDPTPSPRLAELSKKFLACNGRFYHGDEAWEYMQQLAGETISIFLNKYIRPVMMAMERIKIDDQGEILFRWSEQGITVSQRNNSYTILRQP